MGPVLSYFLFQGTPISEGLSVLTAYAHSKSQPRSGFNSQQLTLNIYIYTHTHTPLHKYSYMYILNILYL